MKTKETIPCKVCKGTGIDPRSTGFHTICYACNGRRNIPLNNDIEATDG